MRTVNLKEAVFLTFLSMSCEFGVCMKTKLAFLDPDLPRIELTELL